MNARAGLQSPTAPRLSTRLVTERLVLRPPRTSDVARIRSALRKNASHLRPWSAAPEPGEDPASLTSVSRSVLRDRREWKAGKAFVLLVLLRENEDQVIGRVALGGVHRGAFQNAYLGYWMDAEHQGFGLMTEAVRAATAFAFEVAGLHRLQAAVMPDNGASQRVLDKIGYRREGFAHRYLCIAGTWTDHHLYALTAEEWGACGQAGPNE
jgi:ribosomal-protein-alanine N-acetyltransferase